MPNGMSQAMFLTEEELTSVLAHAKARGFSDFALLLTIYELGCRATEAATLRRADADFPRNTILVHVLKRRAANGKAPAIRCPISPALAKVLQAHIATAPASPWMFPHPSSPDKSINRKHVSYVYYLAAHAAGLGPHREWHPHLLRHSCGTHKAQALGEQGVGSLESAKLIQETLRHATGAMALTYVHASSEAAQKSKDVTDNLTANLLKRIGQ
jgi:integrase